MKSKLYLAAAAALGLAAFAPVANAQTAGLTGFTGGTNFASVNTTNQTIGWTFTANQDITVTSLGFYDLTPATPLGQSHEVGLWDSAGALLTSIEVATTDPLTSGFRYATTSSVDLTSGSIYYIGAVIYSPFSDFYVTGASSVTVDPAITFGEAARSGSSSGFAFPSTIAASNGRFGPNFLFTLTPAAVPEPGSVAVLVGMGLRGRLPRPSRQECPPICLKVLHSASKLRNDKCLSHRNAYTASLWLFW